MCKLSMRGNVCMNRHLYILLGYILPVYNNVFLLKLSFMAFFLLLLGVYESCSKQHGLRMLAVQTRFKGQTAYMILKRLLFSLIDTLNVYLIWLFSFCLNRQRPHLCIVRQLKGMVRSVIS